MIQEDRKVSQVVADIIARSQEILRSEVRLAKTEITEEAAAWARSFAVVAAGLLLAIFGVGVLLLAAVYALSTVLEPWAAAVIVGVAALALGGAVAFYGQRRLSHVHLKPAKTIASVKENVQWVKHQTR
jgi:hypothetical protein